MQFVRLITAMLVVFLASQVAAETELTPHTAQYKVRISVISGQLNTELRKTADGYVAHHVIKPTGLAKLITGGTMDVSSTFSSEVGGVKPIRFQSVDTIRKDPDVDLTFDWTTNEVSGTVGEESVLLQLAGIAHDNVSIQYELMHDLLNGGPDKQYVLFDIDKMRVANVSIVGERQVKTKAGTFTAIGVRHQKETSSRITTLWCVEELGYLPVVIEQHRKGKLKFRATLVKYTPSPE
jgi:Protein of unknown function (DUF3108)